MTLGSRLAVILVIAVWSCLAINGYITINRRRDDLLADARSDALEVGRTLDVVLNEVLRHEPLRDLEHLPDQIAQADRIHGLAILDGATGLLVSSRHARPYEGQLRALAQRSLTAQGNGLEASVEGHIVAYAFPLRREGHETLGAAVVLRDLSHVDEALARIRLRSIRLGLVLAVVATVISLTVSRYTLTRPIDSLIAGVRRVGEGRLLEPIPVERDDEVGKIARALNQMMADLVRANAQGDLERSARAALARSVEDERKMQHAQRLAAIGQIAASLAHEIGSPLHVIAGRARFAAERENPDELRENLRVIAAQADRITRVVQQLLSLGRRRGPRLEPVSLESTAQTVCELLGPQARQQQVTLSLRNSAGRARTTGDADQLQQVLFNLVMNALQVQPNGGEVELSIHRCRARDSLGNLRARVVVDVADRGPGVAPERRERIFEPFDSDRLEQGGTGLGLAVVRGIVRDHNGTVKVLARDGGGAIFRVSLPADDESDAANHDGLVAIEGAPHDSADPVSQ